MIASYQTNTLVSHSIPPNYFRWNFSRWTAGEGRSKGTSQTRSYQGNLHIKTASITSKVTIHHPTPYHTTLRSASGQGKRPGSRTLRRSSTTGWNNFTWLTWDEKCDNIILPKKCESLSFAKEKSLSQLKIKRCNEWKPALPKAGRHEGLKIPFWRQSTGSPPPTVLKTPELFSDSNDSGVFFFVLFSGSVGGTRDFLAKREVLCAQLKSII